MRIQIVNNLFFILLTLSLTTMSCGKEDPVIGPAGPAGTDGQNGEDGNANIESDTYPIASADWVGVGTSGMNGFYVETTINVPSITQEIIDNGMVLVYFNISLSDEWRPLPHTRPTASFTETFEYTFGISTVKLKVYASDNLATKYNGSIKVVAATSDGLVVADGDGIDMSKREELDDYFLAY